MSDEIPKDLAAAGGPSGGFLVQLRAAAPPAKRLIVMEAIRRAQEALDSPRVEAADRAERILREALEPRPEVGRRDDDGRKWPTSVEIVRGIRPLGPPLATGFPTLDSWTRGGLRPGTLVAIGGAPNAGKTLLALDLAHRLYRDENLPVLCYAADEPRGRMITRWGQQAGLVREDIEAAQPETLEALEREVGERVDFVNADDAPLDEVIAWLADRARPQAGKPGVLVVDSIQRARVSDGEGLEARLRVGRVVDLLKGACRRGLVVLATSEVSRGFYAKIEDSFDPLAAFKESGDIEYALDLAIVLMSRRGEVGRIDAWVPKNRIHPRHDRSAPAFTAHIDFARALMFESRVEEAHDDDLDPQAAEAAAEARAKREHAAVAELAEKILRVIVTAPGDVVGTDGVMAILPGGARKQRVSSALALLRAQGRVVGGGRQPYRLVSVGAEEGAVPSGGDVP